MWTGLGLKHYTTYTVVPEMSELGGLVLFAVVASLIICIVIGIICCCIFIICKSYRPEPLANGENQV